MTADSVYRLNDREHRSHFGPATSFTRGSVLHDVIAFVDGGQQDGMEVDRPQAVVGFPHADSLIGRAQPVTGELKPRREIDDGEGIAVRGIAGAELPVEIGGPQIIRRPICNP